MRRFLPVFFLLAGCPAEEATPQNPADAAAAGAAAGTPGAPAPGTEAKAPADAVPAGTPAPGSGQLPTLAVDPANAVTVSGTVSYSGSAEGTVRVDITTPKDDKSTNVVHALTLDKLGSFKVDLPKGYGKVTLNAFIDKSGDGPSPDEPVASITITIADAPISDVKLELAPPKDKGADPNVPEKPANPASPPADPGAPPPAGPADGAATPGTAPAGTAPAAAPAAKPG